MTLRFVLAAGIALIGIGYLLTQFVVLVLEDADNDHEAAQGPAYDERTVTWLKGLHDRDSEFDEWCEQAIALAHERPEGGPANVLLLGALMPPPRIPAQRTPGASS